MSRHDILGPFGWNEQYHRVSMVNGGDPPARRPISRHGHVSLFRPGAPQPEQAVTLDQRTGRELFALPNGTAALNPARVWDSLTEVVPDASRLAGNGLFLEAAQHPAARHFDILRTRVLQAMAKNGWSRLAVTSPGHGCGKSLVAANLALSLSRLPSCRTVLMDLELRAPDLARLFGLPDLPPMIEFLAGEQPLEAQFRRIGRNLALGANTTPVPLAAETLQSPAFIETLEALRDHLQPDILVFDTPPALGSDDVIALAGQMDAVLLVVDGTQTSPAEIRACERLFEGRMPLLGVVLNRAQDRDLDRHRYGKR